MIDLKVISEKVKLNPTIEKGISSKKAKEYIKLMHLQKEIDHRIKYVYGQLDDEEKSISDKIIMDMFTIPDYVTVKDAAQIIGVSEQMVRRYCSENKLVAEQTMPGSGKWRVETAQLVNYPGWKSFVHKRTKIKEQSINIADFMNDNIAKM